MAEKSMINGAFNCFFETISAGMEAFLKYQNRKYLVQGWFKEDTNKQFLCVDDITHDWDASEIWGTESDNMEDNTRIFRDSCKLAYHGKKFWQVVIFERKLLIRRKIRATMFFEE